MISYLWLAASDEKEEEREGFTLQARQELFVREIALIGRAHNWDHTKINPMPNKEEEYDDLEGDKPSCFSGVKRRLFQSVLGHSLFSRLTHETFMLELRGFVRGYYQNALGQLALEEFQSLYHHLGEDNLQGYFYTFEVANLLKHNIPIESQLQFLEALKAKYREHNELYLNGFFEQAFDASLHDNSHLLKFYTAFGVKEIIEARSNRMEASLEQTGFFASNTTRKHEHDSENISFSAKKRRKA